MGKRETFFHGLMKTFSFAWGVYLPAETQDIRGSPGAAERRENGVKDSAAGSAAPLPQQGEEEFYLPADEDCRHNAPGRRRALIQSGGYEPGIPEHEGRG